MALYLSDSALRKLVRDRKNAELKAIVSRVCPIDLVDSSGKTLLHLAAKYGNVDLIASLLECNCTLNATTSTGMTPLMVAVSHRQFEVTKLLLNAEPDISIRDASGMTALQMAIRRKVPAHVIQRFVRLLRKLNVTTARIVLMLERAGCSLRYALSLSDASILRGLLERRETIGYRESAILVGEAMGYASRESAANLVALMRHGPGRNARKAIFFKEISFEVDDFLFPSLNENYARALVRQLIKANAIDADFVVFLGKVFGEGRKSAVKLWLECDVHVHVKKRYGRDLTTHLFGNRKVNAVKLTRRMKTVDVDGRGANGFSALHFAATNDLEKNVEFLLGKGADPNLKSDLGMTPLFLTRDRKCAKLLLQAGADVQVVDFEGLTALDANGSSTTQELVLAQLAVVEAKGEKVHSYMYDKIYGTRRFVEFYEKCRLQMDWTKRRRIFRSVTLFDVFVGETEKIARYVPNKEKGSGLMDWYYECPLHRYYFSILKRNLKKAVRMHDLKRKAALFVARAVRVCDAEHLVVRRVVGYLSYEDLLVFA